MKPFVALFFCLIALTGLLRAEDEFADGWTDVDKLTLEAASPEATVITYVEHANAGDFDVCVALMTPEYIAWLDRIGGYEASLEKYQDADLEKRFAYRVRPRDDERVQVRVRYYSVSRGREVNVSLNVRKTAAGWKLTL